MNRAPLEVAAILAIVAGSGTPVYALRPPVAADVGGLEALTHRPLLSMGVGPGWGGAHDPCDRAMFALYEDGLVIYTTTKGSCPTVQAHITPTRARELADTVAAGLSDVPHHQWASNCTDQGGLGITVRHGTRWVRTSVGSVDRFGHVTCDANPEDRPHPNTVAAMRLMASFDAPDAVPWVSTEFAVVLGPSKHWPEASRKAVPWPEGLPPPHIDAELYEPVTAYDVKYLDAANSIFSGQGPPFFVRVGETTWLYGTRIGIMPEWAYLTKVDEVLSRVEQALDHQ